MPRPFVLALLIPRCGRRDGLQDLVVVHVRGDATGLQQLLHFGGDEPFPQTRGKRHLVLCRKYPGRRQRPVHPASLKADAPALEADSADQPALRVRPVADGDPELGGLMLEDTGIRPSLGQSVDVLAHGLPLPLVRSFRPALGHALVLSPAVASLYGQLPACVHALPHLAVVLEAPAVVDSMRKKY